MLDTTSFAAALKTLYPEKTMEIECYKNHPLLAMVPKAENFEGANLVIPVSYSFGPGISADFGTAQTNADASAQVAFTVTRASTHAVAKISSEVIEASKSDKGAFVDALKHEMDSALQGLSEDLAATVYGSGSGSIGKISAGSNVATATITLSDIEQIVNFYKGQKLALSSADGTGSLRDSGDVVTVSALDRDAGTVTVSTTWSGISGASASDFIFPEGAHAAKMKGLAGWVPLTAPSATAFFGVDRTADVTRLGGVRFTATGLSIEEALVKAGNRVSREGGKPDVCFMNHSRYQDLVLSLGSKVQYTDSKVGDIGFEGLRLVGPTGSIKVIPDPYCPTDRAYMLQLNTWKLYTLGKMVKINALDGNQVLRMSSSDGIEIRLVSRGNLTCKAPGRNAVIVF